MLLTNSSTKEWYQFSQSGGAICIGHADDNSHLVSIHVYLWFLFYIHIWRNSPYRLIRGVPIQAPGNRKDLRGRTVEVPKRSIIEYYLALICAGDRFNFNCHQYMTNPSIESDTIDYFQRELPLHTSIYYSFHLHFCSFNCRSWISLQISFPYQFD